MVDNPKVAHVMDRANVALDTALDKIGPVRKFYNEHFASIRAICGEFLVTFCFIFIVCSTQANLIRAGLRNPNSGPIATGFAACALIYSFADISGAHFNPAVTFATILRRRTHWLRGIFYIIAQLLGAIIATALLDSVIYPGVSAADLVVRPADDASLISALIIETFMSFTLVFVIFAVAFDAADTKQAVTVGSGDAKRPALTVYTASGSSKAGFAPLSIGFTLGFLCYVGGTVSGGAFNPARAFSAAVVAGDFRGNWVFWIGDLCGSSLAALVQWFFATKHTEAAKQEYAM
ncbi:putative MIP plasma membrane transporter [Paratrimastix pyriformis]|uniref:MIP plasma membrane transporter n=1 Tax=Paratrimastix pyriformis TaxID=342808 RepID=A0ABQ8UE09_9EUKA|nr:putative MIP plasma membrane transporter [Paratrimastix pyriformis]|eukprot:GAFH01002854.1.p1 GENE.GAFH01002854.1~~GAFH01002854.1.p1  ORF type:complete len:292 (+),score=61.83 GAFH01002854.1:52-927(+)